MDFEDIPMNEQEDQQQIDLDEYTNAKVLLPNKDGIKVLCKVKGANEMWKDKLLVHIIKIPS